MRKFVLVLGLAALSGCDDLLGRIADVSAIVRVVDERDDPLRPDRVVWYYPTDSGRHDGEHRAQCISAGCTRWGLPAELTGRVYVAASWSRPTSPGCAYTAYDVGLVAPSDDDPPTVTLRLNTRQESCA